MGDRLKKIEIELSYLRKEILELKEFIITYDKDNHIYYTNVFYSKDYLNSLTEDYERE